MLTENKTSGSTTQTTRYTYDANGNTLTKTSGATSEQYSYDGFNRLMKVVNGVGTTTYAYRPDGLRSSKTVAGVQTTHIWDGQNMSAELDKTGAVLRTYIRGIGLIAEDNAAGARQYALYNAHGDVVQLTDKNGAVTKEYLYDAFGNERSPDANDANPFRYCGEYFDAEIGDIYLRARYYRPVTGRFITEDTHWNPKNMIYGDEPEKINQDALGLNTYTYRPDVSAITQSGNLYVYGVNNPKAYIDFSGLWTVAVGNDFSAAFIAKIGTGNQLVVDDKGNIGILFYGSMGLGTPSAGGGTTLTVTDTPTISELSGLGWSGGGSSTIPVGIVAGVTLGEEVGVSGKYHSATFSVGAGTSLPEAHIEGSVSGVLDITQLLKNLGVYNNAVSEIKKTYKKLTKNQKNYLKTQFKITW